jgi:hypothetical protein
MKIWHDGIVQRRIGNTIYLSIVFTWDLPKARAIAEANPKKKVIAGGPAVSLMPDYLQGYAEMPGELPSWFPRPVSLHNPFATFTSIGCPNSCPFCAVNTVDGPFREIPDFIPGPTVCDPNFLHCSETHIKRVIDALSSRYAYVDFNQGLDAELFTDWHASQLRRLNHCKVRFSWDCTEQEKTIVEAITRARLHGLNDIGVYVLFGYDDTPEDAKYRLEKVREWGIRPNAMRYQPLDCLVKNSYVAPGWTKDELRHIARYYNRLRYLEHVPYEEYRYGQKEQERLL